MSKATDSTSEAGSATLAIRSPRLELEQAVVATNRLSRALWLALRGLAEDSKTMIPGAEDFNALDELAWRAHSVARDAESSFFEMSEDRRSWVRPHD